MSNIIGRAVGVALIGINGHIVEIESSSAFGLSIFNIAGLPDISVKESKDRVRAAITSCGLQFPVGRVIINLSPASLRKQGTGFDLAIAISLCVSIGEISQDKISDTAFIAELGLDGRLRPVRGILPAVFECVKNGVEKVVVAKGNEAEAKLIEGIEVTAANHLSDLLEMYGGKKFIKLDLPPVFEQSTQAKVPDSGLDMAEVIGQELPKQILEIAAAGGHHCIMVGPPGIGKTMLAARMPSIMPKLSPVDSIQVTSIHSISGSIEVSELITKPPFEAPHHTATAAAIIGGGSGMPKPGSVSRAHKGILFMDEAPEFSIRVLQTLRQPLESGEVAIDRVGGTAKYPARFQLVMAANPCPCGMFYGTGEKCTCSPIMRRRYFGKLSGPLLDRIDLQLDVEQIKSNSFNNTKAETSAQIAERVQMARLAQAKRWHETPWTQNCEIPGSYLRKTLNSDQSLFDLLNKAFDEGILSLRGVDRAIRVAWTIADLAGKPQPEMEEISSALFMRPKNISEGLG